MKHTWGTKDNWVSVEDEGGFIYDLYKCMNCGKEYKRDSFDWYPPMDECKGRAP